MLVQIYKILRLVIIIFTSSYFLGILWHIYAVDIVHTRFEEIPLESGKGVTRIPIDENFRTVKLNHDDPENTDSSMDRMVKVWYFAITTLSTIGFGDFHPVTPGERILASFVLLFGVAIFSFIMSQFIQILMNYKSLWQVSNHRDLSMWIALLSRFNSGNPLGKELITKIEDFFNYYWEKNRLAIMRSDLDRRFLRELPDNVQADIFINYLFNDFLYLYKGYFSFD